jgi:hypothetical protein
MDDKICLYGTGKKTDTRSHTCCNKDLCILLTISKTNEHGGGK